MSTAPGDALPSFGDAFASKYTLIRVVGEGGVGIVYEAQHQRLHQRVAIKVLRAEVRESDEWLTRFEREARAAVKLRGPNVARVLDVDSLPDGTPYMVMELLKGHDLGVEIDTRGAFPVAEAVVYMLEACGAMAEAHAYGIIHRDLTPRNLFLAEVDGRRVLKVLDFGISKVLDDSSHVTATDAAFGTPDYVSPEQIRSSSTVDARADIWSLGVILFEMLTARLPFEAPNAAAVVAAVIADPPQSLREIRPDLPPELIAAVMKTLLKNPAQRYSRIEDFAAAIAPFGPADMPFVLPSSVRYATPIPPKLSATPVLESAASEPLPSPSSRAVSNAGWARSERRGWLSEPNRSTWIAVASIGAALVVFALIYQSQSAHPELTEPSAAVAPPAQASTLQYAAPTALAPAASPSLPSATATPSATAAPSGKPKAGAPRPAKVPQRPRSDPADMRANPLHL